MAEDQSAFLLKLLNSAPVVDGVRADELRDEESARQWLAACRPDAQHVDRKLLQKGRDLLQEVIRGQLPATALAPLLEGVRSVPSVTSRGLSWAIETSAGRALVVEAVLAWDHLGRSTPGRLRPCANDECELFLIDHSRSNSARWCSMAMCGNKLKARRHYQRVRGAGASARQRSPEG